MKNTLIVTLLFLSAAACIESREGPPLHPQSRVSYGSRVYLADREGLSTGASGLDICGRMTTTVETLEGGATTSSLTLAQLVASPDFTSTDGETLDEDDLRRPQTCFVPIRQDPGTTNAAGTLLVDRLEVTNDLFQFCVDSGFCAEPDPSKADQNDICEEEGQDNGFFDCPVVEVTLQEARRFCQYIGRRLPTAIESIIIRQAAWTADPNGTRSPENMRVFPALASGEPTSCTEAHLGGLDCGRPERLQPSTDDPDGAAENDIVRDDVLGGEAIFDLTGHVAEWAQDGFPASSNLPWFCLGPVDREDTTGEPTCPELALPDPNGNDVTFETGCVYGYYDPNELEGVVASAIFGDPNPGPVDLPYGLYPVCVIGSTGRFAGQQGFLFGGSWRDTRGNQQAGVDPDLAGTFGRRVEPQPDEFEDELIAQQYGIRCVDDRQPGLDDNGDPFPFDSTYDDADQPGPQIDVDFTP